VLTACGRYHGTPAAVLSLQGASGACCVKTKQAVLIGIYAEGAQAGDCNTVVEKLADYLIGAGY